MKKHVMIFAAVMLVLGVAGEAMLKSRPSEPQPGTPEWQQGCVQRMEAIRKKIPTIATLARYDDENCRAEANCLQHKSVAQCDYPNFVYPHDERPYQLNRSPR